MVFVANSVSPLLYNQLQANYTIITLPEINGLYEGIRNHADLVLSIIDDHLFISNEIAPIIKVDLDKYHIPYTIISEYLGTSYPSTAQLNVLCTHDYLICNEEIMAEEVKDYALKLGKRLIHVKQGYIRCTTLPLGNNAFITDDDGIYNALIEEGLNVLKISKGNIHLPGQPYGFIGGCGGRVGDAVYFNGHIKQHPDHQKIIDFIHSEGLKAIDDPTTPLTDIGSILIYPSN